MIYYISDLHIGHKAAIRFDKRPFTDVQEMEREIILRWNEKITAEDDVFILGDIFYSYRSKPADFLRKLNGRLHLITGNHDYGILKDKEALAYFADVDKLRMIIDNDRRVVLCHYPLITWNMKHFGSYHVYGHVHRNIGEEVLFMMNQERAYNAGCMINGYAPCTLEEVEQNNRKFRNNVMRGGFTMLIFKQKLPMDTIMPIKVALPFSSSAIAKKSILKLDLQYDYPVMWYQADYETVELGGSDSAEPVSKDYIIASIGTGHDWGDTLTQDHYIGTVMIYGGSLVLHYFIVDAADKSDKACQEVGSMYNILEAMQQVANENDEDDAYNDDD